MAEGVQILSLWSISPSELQALALELGGELEKQGSHLASIQGEDCAVWIGLCPVDLLAWIEEDGLQLTAALGSVPKSLVYLDRTSDKQTFGIMVRFTSKFFDLWPESVVVINNVLHSKQDFSEAFEIWKHRDDATLH